MTEPADRVREDRQSCSCTFGISPACPAHGKKKRDRRPAANAATPPNEALALSDNRPLTVRLHEIVHGSDENCAYGGIGCPIRRDINIELQRSALSSRDAEISEVLEGLRGNGGCWCPDGNPLGMLDHSLVCLAARALYEKLQPE